MGFKYIHTLEIRKCNSLRCVFAPAMTKSIPQLCVLKISSCEMLSTIVGKSSVGEVEFPQLESLELLNLPNLVSFFPNVNVNTTTVAKLIDHLHNPMQPQPLFNEKVAILCLEYLVPVGLQSVRDLWGSEFPTSSFSNLKNLQVAGCSSLRNFPSTSTQGLQEVAQLLYTDRGNSVLALGSNGTMMLWKWGPSQHNPFGMATTSVLPQQWEPPNGLAMTNDVTSVNLEEAVPCMALSKNYFYMISACGGKVSLFNMSKFREMQTSFMPPPPASTFLAFYPRDNNIIAIGMEDSTIRMYNVRVDEVKSELKGQHNKRITGLAFSTNLNILVSSGTDAQLCIWSIDTWEHLKSVPLQLPADKARNGDTRWVPQDVLPAPISFAAYSCDSQLVYTSFCDGNIGVFDVHSLTLTRRIAPSIYLSPAMLSG
ncbi:hypothetical protein RHGRI_006554 [Rhododendron griersonianum]|uniref:Disease resistance protein At4g27190-like leucine-rich repeats domain-containing protein n=1 Tax=Rhododendron griersonianum TaxID=479676 RepID=A0AAV6KTY5_9ERIC|nr:hypothetical protein RHGRI_006554 [Rhododendron griersonianum]